MKLLSALFSFIFIVIVFTVITIYTTTIVLYTIDEYLKSNDTNIIIYIEKNISEYI